VWTKEFQDLPTSSQQIKRLKNILADLGMDGRLSMEKAKAIKAKRDLAKELGRSYLCRFKSYNGSCVDERAEDVRSFEQAVMGKSSYNRSNDKSDDQGSDSASGSEHEDEREFSDDAPTKQKAG
jgi:F0F1-type ATP synthase beta subunit